MGSEKERKLWFLCAGASEGRLPKVDESDEVEGLLFSTGYDCKSHRMIEKTKETINIARPKHTLLDSGGFQVFSAEKKGIAMTFNPEMPLKITKKEFNLAPRHVVQMTREINADSMVALDYPIRKIKNPADQEKEFQEKLHYNVPWAIETVELKKKLCPEVNLFIPVQAYNLEQFEEFYSKIRGIDFDGFSLPIRNMTLQDIARFLLKMHKWGV